MLDYHLNSQNRSLQGVELLRAIRKTDSTARIVVLSGREKNQMMPELMKENIEDYIVKDMNSLAELDRILVKYFG